MSTGIILVIDDDEDVRLTLGADLFDAGHLPVFAENAETAIDTARHELPDLILLDLRFPGGGGLEVLRRLKGMPETAEIPVIVFSGQKSDTLVGEALRLGARAYVQKSFTSTTLAETMELELTRQPDPTPAFAVPVPTRHLHVVESPPAADNYAAA
jgi:CheY-like chemotaxis protein